MRALFFLIWSLLFVDMLALGQEKMQLQLLTSGTNTSLRGMSVPSDDVVWVSGSNGTIGKSVDGGKSWRWLTVAGLEKRDFRDIEAFDSSTAIAMAVDNPACIIKTTDGGTSWKKVFERNAEGMFLDAIDFKNEKEGICIGDPLKSKQENQQFFYLLRTHDGGETWQEEPTSAIPVAEDGEAIFSASGTNIYFLNHSDFEYAFVTGGTVSNLHFVGRPGKKSKTVAVPMLHGKETTGIFSVASDKEKAFYCVGGDYKVPGNNIDNYYFTINAGNNWKNATISHPFGYRSCIQIIKGKTMVACGTTGVDFANNGQKEWHKVSLENFNVCMVSKGKKVFLAGEKGKIGRLFYY